LFQVTFLGTSASAPSFHRGLSSQVVQHNEHRFLIDCGEGTQRQILRAGIGFKRLNRILITHGHLDHILGLGGLISTLARWETMEYIEIMGGWRALERIRDLLFRVVFRGVQPPIDVVLEEIKPGFILDEEDFSLTAFQVHHRGADSLGYLFEEKSRRPFLPEKAAALEIPPGPWRADLVKGQAITLPDGRIIEPDQVLGEVRPGTRFAHVGDTGQTDNLLDVVRDVDALVIEATYLDEEVEMANQFGHLTAQRAAKLANEANIKHLILTHLSRRYRERDVLNEARSVFPKAFVARDFDCYQVRRGECEKIENQP
jgi:ribonuclease Z